MHDWTKLVREQMSALSLPSDANRSVIDELAVHLEETYEALRAQGLNESEAVERTLQEAGDWRVLATAINGARSEEGHMNERTRRFWLPAMANLLASMGSLMVMQRLGMQPRLVWVGPVAMSFYWPWLAVLPLFGALGANWARQTNGSFSVRLAAGLSPALVLLGLLCALFPWGLAHDGISLFRLFVFSVVLVNWVGLPALALLMGALPFLKVPQPGRASPRSIPI